VLDEFAFYHSPKELLWQVLYPTTSTTAGKILIITTSPDNATHYSNELFEVAITHDWYYKATIYDDETYLPAEIEALKVGCLDEFSWKINYLCELGLIAPTKIVVPEWIETKYKTILKRPDYYNYYKHYLGEDSAFRDFTAVVYATHYFKEAVLYFEGESQFLEQQVRSDIVTDEIKKKAKEIWGPDYKIYRAIGDSADPIFLNELNKYGFSFFGVEKKLLRAMVNEFRELVQRGQIQISPDCKYLLSNMKNAIWDEKGDKLDKDAFNHHFDHLMAALYLSRHVMWNENPVPVTYNYNPNNMFFPDIDKQTKEYQMQKAFGVADLFDPMKKMRELDGEF
jgi:hypothetical protein